MNAIQFALVRRGGVCRVFTPFLLLFAALLAGFSPLRAAKTPEPGTKDRVPAGVRASDWQGIRAAHEAWRHGIERVKDGWQARNPAQQWTTKFDGRGFEAQPQSAEWTWGLELRSYGAGEEQREASGTPEVKTAGHRLAYHWDDTVQEWFVNDGRGLEHGFSVQERPPGPTDAPLRFVLATRGPLRAAVTGDARGVDYRDKSGATVLTYSGLRVWDADGRELDARFAPAKDGVTLQVDAKDARYPLLIDPIAQQAYLKASNTDAGDFFGASVAISGDTVLVGAYAEDSNAAGVTGNQADNSASSAGAAYVFTRTAGIWTQQAYLKGSNTGAGDSFGYSVAMSGDTLVVGAPGEDSSTTGVNSVPNEAASGSGAVYVFVRNAQGAWSQQAYLKASNTGEGDEFGDAVAISGASVVVGAYQEESIAAGVNGNQNDNSQRGCGAAYVFVRNAQGAWSQQAYLKASNTGRDDGFGDSVAISGDTIVAGAGDEDGDPSLVGNNDGLQDAGAAYVFVRVGTNWSQQAYLKASNPGAFDSFGGDVAVSGNTLVAGANGEDSSTTGVNSLPNELATNSGAAYVFVRNGTDWTQQAYLKASNTGAEDLFGSLLAISGDTVVVSAYPEDGNPSVLGNNDGLQDSGAAYVFIRNGTSWSQQAYLKASNAGARDQFAFSVAVAGDTVVVGASDEDSGTTGVNSVPNEGAANSGAAYVFTGLGPAPVITSPAAANGQVDVLFSYQITTSGGTPNSFGATGLPAGLNINNTTGVISGKPRAAGTSVVAISASNAAGTGTATVTLRVTVPPPPPPVITSPTTDEGQIGLPFTYQITTSGGTADNFLAVGLPAGLRIDATSGLIEGTPAQEGIFTVALLVTGATGSDTETLTLEIAADIDSLKFLPPKRTVTAGKTVRLTLLVANDLTRAQNVRAVFFLVDDDSGLVDPAPVSLVAPGKKKANQGPKLSRVRVEIPVPAAATAGRAGVVARVGDQTASSQLTIKARR